MKSKAYLVGYISIETRELVSIGVYSSSAFNLSYIPNGLFPIDLVQGISSDYSDACKVLSETLKHPAFNWIIEAVNKGEITSMNDVYKLGLRPPPPYGDQMEGVGPFCYDCGTYHNADFHGDKNNG